MTVQEKTITLSGLAARYLEDGEDNGRALLLLHGPGTAALNWKAAMPALAEHYRVIAPDLPGFGGSAALPNQHFHVLMHWIRELLDALDLQQAVVVGNAIGALVARLFAAAEPQYVPVVILINGGGVPNLPAVVRMIANSRVLGDVLFMLFARLSTSRGSVNRMIHVESVRSEEFAREIGASAPGFADIYRMLARDPLPEARTPLVPTLILWGAEDKLATLDEAERIKASIPGAVLSPIAECGQMPQLEATEVFTWQVHQFLENLSRPQKTSAVGRGLLTSPRSSD